jgi:acetyltransferase-like isoleucine patch superfamily enzyme
MYFSILYRMTDSSSYRIKRYWKRGWMKYAGLGRFGRFANRMAALAAPPHKARTELARLSPRGFVSPHATVYHTNIQLGKNIFIGDGVVLFQREKNGSLTLGDRVYIYRDTILETGFGGSIVVRDDASIHPRCQINAFVADIEIGKGVMIAPNCALYSYNHGILPEEIIRNQPLESKGPIVIEEEVWIGVNATILSGVHIGKGAVIAAGAVVMHDVPEGAIVGGNPARIIKNRNDLKVSQFEKVK